MPSLVSELAPSWLPTCCASGQTARHIESVPGARRLRALKLDILAIEQHYRHGTPSRKDSQRPPYGSRCSTRLAGAGLVAYSARRTALETDTANEVNSDRPR